MSTVTRGSGNSIQLVAIASLIGTTIEWYDFFLYNTAAALVFNKLFFPTFDPFVGTLLAFSTYAVGFAARPIGGIVIGHYGDRVGRKSMLVLTLIMMGLATACIGLLPTYNTIGVWAPVILVFLRVVQGFGVGGQWGGAVLMTVEHAPEGQRGYYGSWPQIGVPAGLLTSTIVFSLFSKLPADTFMAWGWRVPFILSLVLVAVGLLIRLKILETPSFTKMKETKSVSRQPVLEVLQKYPKQVLQAAGARCAENGAFYIYSAFMLVYATQKVKISRDIPLNGIMIASALEFFFVPFYGWLTDRIGRRPVYMFGAVMTAVLAFPLFWLFDTGSTPLIWLALLLVFLCSHAPMYAPQGAFFSELFGTSVRYSGASLGAQLSAAVAGGFSPLIATALLPKYGSNAIALYIILMALITIVAVWSAVETLKHGLEDQH
ncbi:MAG TPA: MFS transporter [Vicinamibacterales bacterium]|nr:MFS transporter [Vicinamibacterales bacterium]